MTGWRSLALFLLGLSLRHALAHECLAGSKVVGTGCELCEIGTYQDLDHQEECITCPLGGTTAEAGANSKSLCLYTTCEAGYFFEGSGCAKCPLAYYRPLNAATCVYCGNGFTTIAEGSTSSDDCVVMQNTCVAGQYYDSSECLLCPANTYQPNAMQTSCLNCPPDTSTLGEVGRTSVTQCIDDVANLCEPGHRLTVDGCTPCPVNTYQPNSGSTDCISCPDGRITLATGAVSVDQCVEGSVTCQPGTYRNAAGSCTACDKGTYSSTTNAVTCIGCAPGLTTVSTGATSINDCVAICPSGSYRDGAGLCRTCPRGTYSELPESPSCTSCPVGQTTLGTGATSSLQCITDVGCGPGNYLWANIDCRPCRKGSYQPEANQVDCIHCPQDLTTRDIGSTSESQCVPSCVPGTYVVGASCVDCPKGEYQHQNDQTFCFKCSPGMTTLETGTPHISGCVVPCVAGEFFEGDECKPCPIGSYQPNSASLSCEPCPVGYTTDDVGATSPSMCRAICLAGHKLLANGNCEACPIGEYQPQESRPDCLLCPLGLTTRSTGSTAIQDCVVICQPGFYPTSQNCRPCELGTYQPEADKQACLPCPARTTTRETGAVLVTSCVAICEPGTFISGDQCVPCAVGYYQFESEKDECLACTTGFTTIQPGADSVDDCVRVCDAGQYISGTTCEECALGTYQPLAGSQSCLNCQSGFTTVQTGSIHESDCVPICTPGYVLQAKQCVPCGLGFYQPDSGKTSCLACPQGYSTSTIASTSDNDCIEICRPGTFLDGRECVACAVGTYQPEAAKTSCLSCPVGMSTMTIGTINRDDCMIMCPAGQYWDRSQRLCQVCVQGSYSSQVGSLMCSQCADGYSTIGTGTDSPDKCYELCDPGNFLNAANECEPCPIAFYKPTMGFAACTSCGPDRTTQDPGATSSSMCLPRCEAGHYLSQANSQCLSCALGYYQPLQGQMQCEQCPDGQTTLDVASTDRSQCILQCAAGFEVTPSGLDCAPCLRGYYKSAAGPHACVPCRSGYITEQEGSTRPEDCSIPDCDAGTFIQDSQCIACPVGMYQPAKWQSTCLSCDQFHTTSSTGSKSESDCYFTCAAGQYQPSSALICQQCAVGTYKPTSGTQPCSNCTAGYKTATTGSKTSAECNIPICSIGNYLDEAVNFCYPCSKGFFQDKEGQTSCVSCGVGLTTYPDQFGNFGAATQAACLSTNACLEPSLHDCDEDATCTDLENGHFRCTCMDGYIGNGRTCMHMCDSSNGYCLNGGTCVRAPLSCDCADGYNGARCENEVEGDNLGTILGAVLGTLAGLLLLALLGFLIWYCCCRQPDKMIIEKEKAPPPAIIAVQPAPTVTTVITRTDPVEYIDAPATNSVIGETPYATYQEKPLNLVYTDSGVLNPSIHSFQNNGLTLPPPVISSTPGFIGTAPSIAPASGYVLTGNTITPGYTTAAGAVFDPAH